MILFLLSLLCSAKELPGEELFLAPSTVVNPVIEIKSQLKFKNNKKMSSSTVRSIFDLNQNIPSEYSLAPGRQSTISELVQPPKGVRDIFQGVKVGDILDLSVSHSVIAFPDEKAPVIAVGESGQIMGFKFIGESILSLIPKESL